MRYLNLRMIVMYLGQLVDREYLKRLWTGRVPGYASSLGETLCGLFDDSGLGISLDRSEHNFSKDLVEKFRCLERKLKKLESLELSEEELLIHPSMDQVHALASDILALLKESPEAENI